MSTDDDEPRCYYCQAPGDFRGAACYGCIKLAELAERLTETANGLDALRNWLSQRPELRTDPFVRDTLRRHSDNLHRILNTELARYTSD